MCGRVFRLLLMKGWDVQRIAAVRFELMVRFCGEYIGTWLRSVGDQG